MFTKFRWINLLVILVVLAGCQNSDTNGTVNIDYAPPAIPVKLGVSVDSDGQVSFSVEPGLSIPTPIGTFSASVGLEHSFPGVQNYLVIDFNGNSQAYDLQGQTVYIDFQSGYYEKISLEGPTNGNWLLVLERRSTPTIEEGRDIDSADAPRSNPPAELPETSSGNSPQPNPPSAEENQPSCSSPGNPFFDVWSNNQNRLGCPRSSAQQGLVVIEHFQNGMMFWRSLIDTSQALVGYSDYWQIYQHSPYPESPEYWCPDENTPQSSPPTPRRGFGMMWCDIPEIRRGLGNATDAEQAYQNGFTQSFDNGFMILADRIYVFYNDGDWEIH